MLLFAYGSLKRGKSNHYILENSEYLGKVFTDKNYTMFIVGLPYMVKRKNGGGVEGELYRVDKDTLRILDVLEGHPDFYYRETIQVYDFEDGHMREAYAYLHPDTFTEDNKWKYEQVKSY